MARTLHPPRPRRGFTLVELLVVITIIGILAGLITAAAFRARVSAKNAVTKSEISQIAMAVEAYKTKYGEYPPDLTDMTALNRHLRKAFPRYTGNGTTFLSAVATAYGASDTSQVGPGSALVIFIGGLPENPGSTKPAGFHADPANPFRTGSPRTAAFYDFDSNRVQVKNGNVLLCYYQQPDPPGAGAPYVYFKSQRLQLANKTYSGMYDEYLDGTQLSLGNLVPLSFKYTDSNNHLEICVPYLASVSDMNSAMTLQLNADNTNPREWRDAGKFQIISAGLDNLFGDGNGNTTVEVADLFRVSRTGEGFSTNQGDFDNLASFAQGTLENEIDK